jgi:hypothetical protein
MKCGNIFAGWLIRFCRWGRERNATGAEAEKNMSHKFLANCIRSGQLSAQQIAEVMRGEVFAAWYEARYGV